MAFTSSTPSFVSANTPDTLPSSTVFSALARVLVRVSTPSFSAAANSGFIMHSPPLKKLSSHMSAVGVLPSVPE